MKIKQRTEITTETYQTTIIRFRENRTTFYCQVCQEPTSHFSLAQEISMLPLGEAEIKEFTIRKAAHSLVADDRDLWLCIKALAEILDNKDS